MMAFVQSQSVFQWPDWKAFAERLGISDEPYTTAITIRIAGDEVVKVTQESLATDRKPVVVTWGDKLASEPDTPVVATEARKVDNFPYKVANIEGKEMVVYAVPGGFSMTEDK